MSTVLSYCEVLDFLRTKYPSLGLPAFNEEDYKLAIMDNLFNTVGSGSETLIFQKPLKDYPAFLQSVLSDFGQKIYYLPDSKNFATASQAFLMGFDCSELLELRSRRKVPFFSSGCKSAYPNFKKEYSFIWRDTFSPEVPTSGFSDNYGEVPIEALPLDWFDAATYYYKAAAKFFSSEYDCRNFHDAFNKWDSPEAMVLKIESFEKSLKRYNSKNAISKAYGVRFDGDARDLLEKRWRKRRREIRAFIAETLLRIEKLKKRARAFQSKQNT